MLTVALIGYGGMGKMHGKCYAALKDVVKLVAVADVTPESGVAKYAEEMGAKCYASGNDLLAAETPDIIDICLPTFLHTEYSVKAMEKGCHVFCEKPICLNEEEAKLLLETEKKTGVKVQVGQVVRFMKEYKWLKKAVESGTYGKVISAVFTRLSANPRWAWNNWFNDPEKSGTMALDLHVHDVDFIRYLLGEPDTVESKCTRNAEGVLQQIFTTYTFGDTVVTSEGIWDYPDKFPFSPGFRVKMEKGTAVLNRGLMFYPVDGEPFVPEMEAEFEGKLDAGLNVSSLGGYYTELRYFIEEIIQGNGKPIAPLSEAIKSAELVWKEIESAGGKVKK